ncbi:MAG TPA: hypothetical protein VGE02_14880 [Gemmatimonadales bacterium]
MRRTALLGSCLAMALAMVGCQDKVTAPVDAARGNGPSLSVQSGSAGSGIDRGSVRLPASARITDQQFAGATRRAIDPGDYVCPPSTPVVDWFIDAIDEVRTQEPEIFDLLFFQAAADIVPTYEALLIETDANPQYFGYDGEYTKILIKTDRDARRFWDIFSDDIQLIGMHGSMLLDLERTTQAYEVIFGLPHDVALVYATAVRDALLASETLDGGNHPIFSFNAFAFSTFGGSIPDKIVMGDGILAGYAELGFADVAPQAVYAHEFAHHIQFENGYFEDPYATTGSAAEQTRYTELMADAMSAYFLTHKRGAAMNQKRVVQFLEVFYQIGDCGFTSPGHHGTPNQRMAAAQFGFDLADAAQKQGHILTSEQFHDLFVEAYPEIVAPDAP